MIDIKQFGKGALVQAPQIRNYRLEVLPGTSFIPAKFSLKNKVGKIKNQNGSSSCSSQATSYYAEVLNLIETGEMVQLSPKFLYSFVAYPYEGSYIKDNMSRVCNFGIALESDIPSYQGTTPPSEAFMIQKPGITPEVAERAMTHWARKYVTWDNTSVDLYKRAIIEGNGCVVASWGNNILWQTGDIQLPYDRSQMTWTHAIYLIGYDDEKQAFEFVNSFGENWGYAGFGWLPYKYATEGYLTNPHTLVDLPNGIYSIIMKLIGAYKNVISLLKK
jgi:C1A family cysteine protease